MRTFYTLALVFLPLAAYAQNYEFGVHGGTSLYNSKTVSNARGSADTGFKTGWVAGFTLGHDMYDKLGGEIRYTYLRNDLKVSSGSTDVKFGGEAHAIHYDFVIHTASRESKIRPYVAFGGGVKQFRGTGTEAAFQPLSQFAILSKTSEVAGMLSAGGGIKIAVSDRIIFRVDVHDYLTPFPKDVIVPGPGVSLGGWLNNIVPTAGITFRF